MSPFKLSFQPYNLQLRQPFTISRGSKKVVHNILVKLKGEDYTGWGEAAPNSRYKEDAGKVKKYLSAIPGNFFDQIQTPEQLALKLDAYGSSEPCIKSARAAVEMAWLDWWGKSQHKPLWELWDAPSAVGPPTSFTIGLDDIDVMKKKVEKAAAFPVYKVKLGAKRDKKIIQGLREVTGKPIRVDANEGWETLQQAKNMINFLADKNIEMVEQPMPANRFKDLVKLHKFSPLPLCADESFMGDEPLSTIVESFDIINIKLMKTGSLLKVIKILQKAKKYNLQVMIGCMIESSLANAAGALVSLWADYADLDGHLLIKYDPVKGLSLTNKARIKLSNRSGLGVQWR